MRTMLRFEFGLAETNEAVRSGTVDAINAQLMASTKPEAAYFGTENGRRTGYLVFDMVDSAQIPVIAEPLFQRIGATVEFIPVMNADDLKRGSPQRPPAEGGRNGPAGNGRTTVVEAAGFLPCSGGDLLHTHDHSSTVEHPL